MTDIFNLLGDNLIALAGGIWAVLGVIVSFIAKQYLAPLMKVEKKRKYAGWIAAIADEITDDLVSKYPGRKWLQELDRAVDKIIDICNIDREIAERAIKAAAARKQ